MQTQEKKNYNIKISLYPKQFDVYGVEAKEKLSSLTILIFGLRGDGVETAKNIILSYVKKVIYDKSLISINNLRSNFILEEKDINRRRDESMLRKLVDLNQYTEIEAFNKLNTDENLIELLLKEKINVIDQNLLKNKIIKSSNYCHKNNIIFIYCDISRLSSFIFSDLGSQHITTDINRIEYQKYHFKNMTNDKNAIKSFEKKNFNININNIILNKFVEGISEVNCMKNTKVISKNDDKFIFIDVDKINFVKYAQKEVVCKIKQPIIKNYKIFLKIINFLFNQISEEKRNLKAVEIYNTKLYPSKYNLFGKYLNTSNSILPKSNNIKNFFSISEISKIIFNIIIPHKKENKFNISRKNEIQKFDEKKTINIISTSKSEISPISPLYSLIGGYASKEIFKYTGKYEPIDQWHFFDSSFITGNILKNIIYNNFRCNEMLAIFRNDMKKKLADISLFIIGAGAIGCGVLKNFAMVGISINKNKCSYITKDYNIQLSNLNGQFLFRQNDIGKSKPLIAVNSIKKMNNDSNCESLQNRVNKDIKNIFYKNFLSNLNMFILVIDNINAREYLNEECHKYLRSFIDSRKDGTKDKVNTIIPFVIELLKIAHKNKNMETTHSCTMKYFATYINDCIDGTKENLNDLFYKKTIKSKNFKRPKKTVKIKRRNVIYNILKTKISPVEKNEKEIKSNKNFKSDFKQLSNKKIDKNMNRREKLINIIFKPAKKYCFFNWKLSNKNKQINNIESAQKIEEKAKNNQKETDSEIASKHYSDLQKQEEIIKNSELEPNRSPKGLINLGFSCYMNSLIQCLYYIKEFRSYFINKSFNKTTQPICDSLSKIIIDLTNSKKDVIDPTLFKKEIGIKNNLFKGKKPADAADLLYNLFDFFLKEIPPKENYEDTYADPKNQKELFEQYLKEIDSENIINKLFNGFYSTKFFCPEHMNTNTYLIQNDSFIRFPLEKISKFKKELSLSLKDCFDYLQNVQNNTMFFCEICNSKQTGSKIEKIYRPPKILILIFEWGHGKTFKGKIKFNRDNFILDLKEYIDEKDYNYSTIYKLVSMSMHSGKSSASGHYTSYCLTDNGNYYYFSDDEVNHFYDKYLDFKDPYILFYEMIEKNEEEKIRNFINISYEKHLNLTYKNILEQVLKLFKKNNKYQITKYDDDNPFVWIVEFFYKKSVATISMNFGKIPEQENLDILKIASFDKNNPKSKILMQIQEKDTLIVNINNIKKFHDMLYYFFKLVYKKYFNKDFDEVDNNDSTHINNNNKVKNKNSNCIII